MQVTRRGIFLDFAVDTRDGEKTYPVPAVDVPTGQRLAEILSEPDKAEHKKLTGIDLYKLALGDVWDEMVADRVPYTDACRVGVAALAREHLLLADSSADRWEHSVSAARAILESGTDPKALIAWAEQNPPADGGEATPRKTPPAAASTTRKRASGSGTTAQAKLRQSKASRSSGQRSSRSGR